MRPSRLRPAVSDDLDFLYGLHVATMKPYVEQAFGWNESDQRAMYVHDFHHARNQVVEIGGLPVGRLELHQSEHALWLGNMQLLPAFQRQGHGSALIRQVMADAAASGLPVRLRVLKVNPDAQRLYERLGFRRTEQSDIHVYLEAP